MAAIPTYRFGISEFTTKPWTFEQDIDNYAKLGVDCIEVCEIKLDAQRIDEQLASVGAHHLAISSAQPQVRTLFPSQSQPSPDDPHERMQLFRRTIDRFGAHARDVPFVTNTGIPPNGNMQRVYDVAVQEYRALAEYAAQHGARVALEPLNAAIMNIESAVWTVQQAMDIIKQVDHPAFGICMDCWNVWQNADILNAIKACGDRIFVVQLSDWRIPRSYQDRVSVGTGAIPLPPLLRAIHDTGFRGAYSVEIFSGGVPDSLWEGDLAQLIRDNHTGLDTAWRAAFAEG